MQVPSSSSGCEVAPFFVRHADWPRSRDVRMILWPLQMPFRDSVLYNGMRPKRRFGKEKQKWHPDFRLTFQLFVAQIEYSRPWKVLPSKSGCHLLFLLPKSSFWEGYMWRSGWYLPPIDSSSWYHHLVMSTDTSSWFHPMRRLLVTDGFKQLNLYLLINRMVDKCSQTLFVFYTRPKTYWKYMLPKRRFWKEEQKMKSGFSQHFSRAWVLDLGYEPLNSAAKIMISSFVPPSKIFVWDG